MTQQLERAGHPSLPPGAVPSGRRAGAAVLLGATLSLALAASALADPADNTHKHKASSFAPHHTTSHVYGTPVGKPILHKHKKPSHASKPAADAPLK